MRDDWVDLLDFRESRHRIKKEHLPLPIIYALHSEYKGKLKSLLLRRKITKSEEKDILQIVLQKDIIKHYKNVINRVVNEALSSLKPIKQPQKLEIFLCAFIPQIKLSDDF